MEQKLGSKITPTSHPNHLGAKIIPQIKMGSKSPKRASHVNNKRTRTLQIDEGDTDKTIRTYRYLGQKISPSWINGLEPAREEVRQSTINLLKLTSKLKRLTHDQMREIMDVEVSGNVGYHGRALPLRWKDCEAIETARAAALRAAG